jgi:hypothetical protein
MMDRPFSSATYQKGRGGFSGFAGVNPSENGSIAVNRGLVSGMLTSVSTEYDGTAAVADIDSGTPIMAATVPTTVATMTGHLRARVETPLVAFKVLISSSSRFTS